MLLQKQEQINSGMEEKIGEVMETTNMITPPPPETLKAIAAGTEVTKTAAQQSIQNRSATSGLNRFGGSFYLDRDRTPIETDYIGRRNI
jgi:hypothetical protein